MHVLPENILFNPLFFYIYLSFVFSLFFPFFFPFLFFKKNTWCLPSEIFQVKKILVLISIFYNVILRQNTNKLFYYERIERKGFLYDII
jgi:hypothetical protein